VLKSKAAQCCFSFPLKSKKSALFDIEQRIAIFVDQGKTKYFHLKDLNLMLIMVEIKIDIKV